MDIESLQKYCLSFPHVTENVQWGYDLCFKVDGKLFAVAPLEVAPLRLSFKCSPENFSELCEREGVRPAPYMARAQWVALEQLNTLPDTELRELLAESYRLVWERLPKKRRGELEKGGAEKKITASGRARSGASTKAKAKPSKSKKARAKKQEKRG
jgi:predicted DNA-binding protein (MmcQ/YjbR family)